MILEIYIKLLNLLFLSLLLNILLKSSTVNLTKTSIHSFFWKSWCAKCAKNETNATSKFTLSLTRSDQITASLKPTSAERIMKSFDWRLESNHVTLTKHKWHHRKKPCHDLNTSYPWPPMPPILLFPPQR